MNYRRSILHSLVDNNTPWRKESSLFSMVHAEGIRSLNRFGTLLTCVRYHASGSTGNNCFAQSIYRSESISAAHLWCVSCDLTSYWSFDALRYRCSNLNIFGDHFFYVWKNFCIVLSIDSVTTRKISNLLLSNKRLLLCFYLYHVKRHTYNSSSFASKVVMPLSTKP